jgi:hypothetical protein
LDIEATKRVRDTLDFVFKPVLDAFVAANMKARHGQRWLQFASRSAGHGPSEPLDAYGLCKTILDNWNEVFAGRFDRKNTHKARRLFSTVFEARNAVSHLSIPLNDAEALSYLHAMSEIGLLLKAPNAVQAKLKAAYDAQRRSGTEREPAAPAAPPATPQPLPLPAATPEPVPAAALKPWIEVALPHPDVLANRFKEAEFAADLFAVDSGNVDPTSDYATAKGFFEITFLTEGLKRVLKSSLQRLAGGGGDPVIGLQTAFGGGKTHTMLAAYHLARSDDLAPLRGVAALATEAGVTGWKRPKLAVFVGSSKGTDVSLILKDGPTVHTLWGYIAWRLAGDAGLKLMREAEAARTNPGSDLLVALFRLSGPALILLDELVAYARQLPDDRFEAFLSFIQSLTEAAKMAPGVLVIGSLPESDVEAGGAKGIAALRRLQTVFGRVHSPWLPASGDETYEIIRRRLFQVLDGDGERERDATVKGFHDLYRKNAAEFPPETKEARYAELLRLSYPIHPELFDRLSKDWASLEKFQRTRGVLRFMANVVGVLWQAQTRDPLITPARVPVAHERVRASVLYPLDPAFAAVIDREVDGDGSLPQRMEANPTRRIAQLRAATRAARAVFLCSAPLAGQPNAGLTGPGLRLACAEPGDQLAIFGEALRELSERATYLYEEAGRYWFSTQPTLNRLADERAKAYVDHEVDERIVAVLSDDARIRGGFHRVFAAPDDPTAIDEAETLSLVILSPSTPHAGKAAAKSPATDAVTDALTRCRAAQRRYRNTLFFVAADESLLATAREAMRRAMAWREIVDDKRLQDQLPPSQMRDAGAKATAGRDGAVKAVRAAWSHILYPIKTENTGAGRAFDLDQLTLASKDRAAIPAAIYDKIGPKGDNVAKEKLGPDTLWLNLKPLWPDDRRHLGIAEVAEWFSSYVYLPKLRDRVVLEAAVRDAIAKLDPAFGYADGFDEASGRYRGLAWAKGIPEILPESALLVGADAALEQLGAAPEPSTPASPTGGPAGPGGPGAPTPSPGPTKPTRFYGSVEIDMVRPVKAFDSILNAVVMELQRNGTAKVKLTLEIEAETAAGFDETDIGVVRDNARQLKFKPGSTGFS